MSQNFILHAINILHLKLEVKTQKTNLQCVRNILHQTAPGFAVGAEDTSIFNRYQRNAAG